MTFWIEKQYKKEYINSAKLTGIRYKFAKDFDEATKIEIKKFISFIRKYYYWPIRLNISFYNESYFKSKVDGHKYYGVFFNGDEKQKRYPKTCVAGKVNDKNLIDDVLHAVAHEITHYFQWYFLEEDKRTDRSLEIEANKWAMYVLGIYYDNDFC